MDSIIDQICQPFNWLNQVEQGRFLIFVSTVDGAATYMLAEGDVNKCDPWRVRAEAMFVYWYLLTQGAQLPAIAISIESIESMRSEVLEHPKPKAARRAAGLEALAINPEEIKSYVGAQRIQHAPPATSPIGITEDGSLEIRPGASPRRINHRINW